MLDSVELFQELGVRFALHQRHFLKKVFLIRHYSI
jgi:hypothetical protein